MTDIANGWTGNGATDGTAITTGNVNAAGNGATATRNVSGTPTFNFAGDGFTVTSSASSDIARLDFTLSGSAMRGRFKFTPGGSNSTAQDLADPRNSSTNMAALYLNTARTFQVSASGTPVAGSVSPAIAVNDTCLVDFALALSASPTTSNGRYFYRVKNLTNPTWNTTGEFFYDSLYTLNLGVTNIASLRFGKISTGDVTAFKWEYLGYEIITVNPSDTSSTAAKAYFADAPATVVQLGTPVVTVTPHQATNPTATDGYADVSWGAISGAGSYKVELAAGNDAVSGFTTRSTSATVPYTLSALAIGDYTVGVTANP